jgi:hypothetical protein
MLVRPPLVLAIKSEAIQTPKQNHINLHLNISDTQRFWEMKRNMEQTVVIHSEVRFFTNKGKI